MAEKREAEFLKVLERVPVDEMMKRWKARCRKAGENWREYVPQFARGILLGEEGDMWLSVQASCFHYCFPKLTMEYGAYESFEVSICRKGNSWSAKALLGEDNEVAKKMDGEFFNGVIFEYVPKELVEEFYQECKKKFGIGKRK